LEQPGDGVSRQAELMSENNDDLPAVNSTTQSRVLMRLGASEAWSLRHATSPNSAICR